MKKKLLLITAMAFMLCLAFAFSTLAADTVPASGRLGTNTFVDGIALPSVIDAESQIEMDDGLIYPSFYFFKDQTTSAWDFSRVKSEDGSNKYTINNVIKLEIPHGITHLADMGYRDQNKTTLVHVRIPNTISSNSWNGGFRSTKSLSSVEFEEGYSYKIFESMFHSCPISNFVIPEGVTSIDKESMCDMGLTVVTIPDSVTYIGTSAFTNNPNLTQVIINPTSQLKKIDNSAFSGLHKLTAPFYFPSSIEELGTSVFSSSYNISAFLNFENTKITSIPNNLFYECRGHTSIILPSGITSIGARAFQGCSLLESISIPDTVTSMGSDTFNGCTKLKTVKYSSGLTSVPVYGFYNCKSLESFYMSDNVTYIGQYAFFNCNALGPVYLSKNIVTIYSNGTSKQGAFQNCHNMYFVNNPGETEKPAVYALPDSLINLGGATFKNCRNLNTTLIFHANIQNLDDDGWNFGNINQSTTRNFIFLGEITELKFANENYNTNFYFVNPNVTSETLKLTLTHTTEPTNSYAFVCSEGKFAKLGKEISWTSEEYAHITDPNGRKETAATCTLPKMVADYCYCGKFIEGTEQTEGEALGHDYGAEYYVFTSLTEKGKTCQDCLRCLEYTKEVEHKNAILTDIGYSVKLFELGSSSSFDNGYLIDKELLAIYESSKDVKVNFGVAFNSYDSFTFDGTLDSFSLKANISGNNNVFTYKVLYSDDAHLDSQIVIGIYAYVNDEIIFVNATDNAFTPVSYNSILAEVNK